MAIPMIYVSHIKIEDSLSKKLIDYFESHLTETYIWDETRILSMDQGGIGLGIDNEIYRDILDIAKRVKDCVGHDSKFATLQNAEIVKYPCGAHKNFHKDRTRKTTTGASITYLNDDFIGGHTVVEGVDVQPLQGRTVYFDGMEFRHGVSNVVKRDRYTLSMWYGFDETMPINNDFLEL